MVAVSSIFSPSAVTGVQWPLGPGSSPPLYFQSLQELQSLRTKRQPNVGSPIVDVLKDLPGTLEEDLFFSTTTEEGQFGRIALALMLLGYSGTEECHNLVTPLSWPDNIYFAHGLSIHLHSRIDACCVSLFVLYALSGSLLRSLSCGRIWHGGVWQCPFLVKCLERMQK
jgi:hypothetical protein